jgi:hypothetical protein
LEFLDLKDEYSESELEHALIQHLTDFLLELGDDPSENRHCILADLRRCDVSGLGRKTAQSALRGTRQNDGELRAAIWIDQRAEGSGADRS